MTEDLMLISAQVHSANKEYIISKAIQESWLVILVTTIFPTDRMESLLNVFIIARWAEKDLIREMRQRIPNQHVRH